MRMANEEGTAKKRWYALYTKPHKERQVRTLLDGQSIETYLPTVQRKIRRRDRPERVVFFPCYLFARIDFDAIPPSSIQWLPGMRHIVPAGDRPAVVADEVVALIRERLEGREMVGYPGLKRGDRVRILSGPLRDLEAVFDETLSSADRVRVLLHVMRRTMPVEIDRDQIRRL
jgi:transcriptional antiterminator RfaH